MTQVIFTVGNTLRADDGAGPLLANLLENAPAPGWQVVDGGDTPENSMHVVRRLQPRRVMLIDAADMKLPAGEIRLIPEDCVADFFLIDTHAIPLNFLIDSLKETIPEVIFVGIQPADTSFLGPMTPPIRDAIATLHRQLVSGRALHLAPVGADHMQ